MACYDTKKMTCEQLKRVISCYYMDYWNDAKQRAKMATEFYNVTRKEIEMYTEKLENFIADNCQSPTIIERWIAKVDGLHEKKKNYEEILKKNLNELDEQYDNLRFTRMSFH